jgi:hypothetical protein
VFTTYQRNIQIQRSSQDEFNDFLGDRVRGAQVQTSDRDKPEHNGCRLEDLTAIWPLHTLQLSPAGAQKADRSVAATQGSARRALHLAAMTRAATARAATTTTGATGAAWAGRFLQRVLGFGLRLGFQFGELFACRRHAAAAANERRIELVDVSGSMIEGPWHIGACERTERLVVG